MGMALMGCMLVTPVMAAGPMQVGASLMMATEAMCPNITVTTDELTLAMLFAAAEIGVDYLPAVEIITQGAQGIIARWYEAGIVEGICAGLYGRYGIP